MDLSAGRYEIKVVVNNLRFRRNAFTNNPTGFALDIRKEVVIFRESNHGSITQLEYLQF